MTTKSRAQKLMDHVNEVMGDEVVRKGSDPQWKVEYLPTGVLPLDYLTGGGLPRNRMIEVYGNWCVAPDTLVLTDALSWMPAGEVLDGYGLIGLDEQPAHSRLRPAEVEHVGMARLECVRVVTDQGEITCSLGHGFMGIHRTQKRRTWFAARDLQVGDELLWTTEPWTKNLTRSAGYAAGLIDGEGHLEPGRMSFSQIPGRVLDEGIAALKACGFEVSVRMAHPSMKHGAVMSVTIQGGRWKTLRAIGELRPYRMLDQAQLVWVGRDLVTGGKYGSSGTNRAVVQAVEPVGVRDVVTMQTSTRTFIANGFPSHNSTLKSYVALKAIATIQQAGGVAALIDTEHSYDPAWASNLGVDVQNLVVQQPQRGEEAFDTAEVLVRNEVDLLVFDSVAAILPQSERDSPLTGTKQQPARLAALMSAGLRRVNAANSRTAFFWINQTREKVGIVFGSPETTPGGKSLPFYAAGRINMQIAGQISHEVDSWNGAKTVKTKQTTAIQVRATLRKSKLTSPFRDVFFVYDLNTGEIDTEGWVAATLVADGFTTGSKQSIEWEGRKFRGRQALVDHLKANENARVQAIAQVMGAK